MAQQAAVLILADVGDAERAALDAACTLAGYAPSIEPSAEAATGKLTAKRYDVLVVHLGTPGAALACMRARGKLLRSRIPVVVLVDTDDEASFARAYRAGADEVLLLDRPEWLTARLKALPRSAIPQPGNSRGDAVVADADRTRAEVIERVLRDAGFRVEVAADAFSTRLQAGRPSLKVAVVDASLDDVPSLISQARAKGARCAWVIRARPEQLDEYRKKLSRIERTSVVSAYGPPDDILFEVNRLIEPRGTDGRAEGRVLHGGILRLRWGGGAGDIGYSYNISTGGIFVRTLNTVVTPDVDVELAAPNSDERIRLRCEVVWRREFGATRKEPVPAGFALRIVGGDLAAWTRVCPPTISMIPPPVVAPSNAPGAVPSNAPAAVPSNAPGAVPSNAPAAVPSNAPAAAPAEPELAPAGKALVSPPSDVDIKPREQQSSVEAMLASVLSESTTEDEAAGSAPLSIDGGTVVELHRPEATDTSGEEQTVVTARPVAEVLAAKSEGIARSEPPERALPELLAEALDANKTPLAVPRMAVGKDRAIPVGPFAGAGQSQAPRPIARTESRGAESIMPRPSIPRAEAKPGSSLVPRPSAAAKPESKAPESSRKPDSTEAVPEGKPSAIVRTSSDRPPPLDVSDITPASIGFDLSEDGRIIEAVRPLPEVTERSVDSVPRMDGRTATGSRLLAQPPPSSRPPAAAATRSEPKPSPVPAVVEASAPPPPRSPEVTARVVAHADAVATGDTMRPSAIGLPDYTEPAQGPAFAKTAPLAAFSPPPAQPAPAFGSARPGAPPRGTDEQEYVLPKKRSPLLWIAVAVALGGGAALFASPSLRGSGSAPAVEPTTKVAAAPSAQNTAGALEKTSETVPPAEAPSALPTREAPAASAATVPSATAAAPASAAATATSSGAEIDEATLAKLEPGQGYLFVSSPLATNVYVYGNLAGTTNQRILSKCGPRFLRLGTAPGIWQGEGQVQIVKCGALTRVEMGR